MSGAGGIPVAGPHGGSTHTHGGQGIWAIERSSQVPYHGPCQASLRGTLRGSRRTCDNFKTNRRQTVHTERKDPREQVWHQTTTNHNRQMPVVSAEDRGPPPPLRRRVVVVAGTAPHGPHDRDRGANLTGTVGRLLTRICYAFPPSPPSLPQEHVVPTIAQWSWPSRNRG